MSYLIPGQLLQPIGEDAAIDCVVRILHATTDMLVVIPFLPRKVASRTYYDKYWCVSRTEVVAQLESDAPRIAFLEEGTPQGDSTLSDDELQKKYLRKGRAQCSVLTKRNTRWEMIRPLVEGPDAVLLFDPQWLHVAIHRRANEVARPGENKKTLQRKLLQILQQYWAGNSLKGALVPTYGNCGGRGKQRIQKKSLGRRSAKAKAEGDESGSFCLTERDKKIIAFSWRSYYIRNKTRAKAYRKMCRTFYSEIVRKDDGEVEYILFASHKRPSRWQFYYWGEQLNPGDAAWKRKFSATNLARIGRALLGSAKDGVTALGQRAAVDSSPPDLEFISLMGLELIGGGNRMLVVDVATGYIPGFYYGIDAPSAKTVGLAFLHAASDKQAWLDHLGLDLPIEDWIPMCFTSAIADNTDLRCQAVQEQLARINTELRYVPVARSDMNSSVEVSHHVLHRMVDHNMEGTTYGRRRERGEAAADESACLTILEGMRECARAIHAYNTMPLDIEPTLEMKRAGVEMTRIGLARWMLSQGKVARSMLSLEFCRSQLLPICRGSFTKHGVRLLRDDKGGSRSYIRRLRYVSSDPYLLSKFLEAKIHGRKASKEYFDDDFRYDPYNIRTIWYRHPTENRLIPLMLQTEDHDLADEAALADVLHLEDQDSLDRIKAYETKEAILMNLEGAQDETNNQARARRKEAIKGLGKQPSKKSLKADKKANRIKEREISRDGMAIPNVGNEEEMAIEGVGADLDSENGKPSKKKEPPPSAPPKTSSTTASDAAAFLTSLLLGRLGGKR